MKNTLVMCGFFVLGVFLGRLASLPIWMHESELMLYALYVLLFLVGVGVGGNVQAFRLVEHIHLRVLLVPFSTVVGTFAGVGILAWFIKDWELGEKLAVGAGFGYYSLSSVLITQIHSETLGVLALLTNITREMSTLLLTPVLAARFGKLAPIVSGGATAMDTTLPVITKYSGKQYAIVALISGLVLTILVPFLVSIILHV